jgi:hypothetical protein
MAFVAHTQPPEGSHPSQQEPNLLPPTLLSLRPSRIPTVRGSPLSPPFRQTLVQPVAVIGPVSHHPLRSVWRETAVPVASTAVPSCGRARVTDMEREEPAPSAMAISLESLPLQCPFLAMTEAPAMQHSSPCSFLFHVLGQRSHDRVPHPHPPPSPETSMARRIGEDLDSARPSREHREGALKNIPRISPGPATPCLGPVLLFWNQRLDPRPVFVCEIHRRSLPSGRTHPRR